MSHAAIHIIRVATVISFIVMSFCGSHHEFLCTVELALCKTMLPCAFSGSDSRHYASENIVLFTTDTHGKSLLGATDKEVAPTSCGTHKRRVRLLANLAETVVKHHTDEIVHIVATQVSHIVFQLIGRGITFHIEIGQHNRLLFVALHSNNHSLVVTYRIIDTLCPVLGKRYRTKHLLDFPLHLIDVNIAHYNYRLQVGAIPFLIIVA